MIYVLSRMVLIPGKTGESAEIVSKELMPIYSKLGIQYLASFHGYSGNMNEQIALVAYEDLATMQRSRETLSKNTALQRINAKTNALLVSSSREILEPNPWSPMK